MVVVAEAVAVDAATFVIIINRALIFPRGDSCLYWYRDAVTHLETWTSVNLMDVHSPKMQHHTYLVLDANSLRSSVGQWLKNKESSITSVSEEAYEAYQLHHHLHESVLPSVGQSVRWSISYAFTMVNHAFDQRHIVGLMGLVTYSLPSHKSWSFQIWLRQNIRPTRPVRPTMRPHDDLMILWWFDYMRFV